MARIYLLSAVVVLAVSSPIVRKLTTLGAAAAEAGGHNPISFCNVLFAGNLVALVCLFLVHHRDWNAANLRQISRREWLGLSAVSVVAVALAPSFIFTALSETSVTSVVLLGRIEPPLLLLFGVIFLRETMNVWSVTGSIIALVGVSLTIVLQPMAGGVLMLGRGEIYALAGAICLATGTLIAKMFLGGVPLGIFTVFRTAVGTVVFAAIVLLLFPPDHFMDVLSPVLWRWMLLYGALVVAAGQLLWFSGVRASTAQEISPISSFTPVVAILAAFVILAEVPNTAQYIGGTVILAGVFLGQAGMPAAKAPKGDHRQEPATSRFDAQLGFKGI